MGKNVEPFRLVGKENPVSDGGGLVPAATSEKIEQALYELEPLEPLIRTLTSDSGIDPAWAAKSVITI